ncbi:unnamed protein product, partial [Closterium sp. NIES-53]
GVCVGSGAVGGGCVSVTILSSAAPVVRRPCFGSPVVVAAPVACGSVARLPLLLAAEPVTPVVRAFAPVATVHAYSCCPCLCSFSRCLPSSLPHSLSSSSLALCD